MIPRDEAINTAYMLSIFESLKTSRKYIALIICTFTLLFIN